MHRLGDIIIRAKFETYNAVNGIALPCDHDNGNIAFSANFTGQGQSVIGSQMKIEGYEVEAGRFDQAPQLSTIRSLGDFVTLEFQIAPQERPSLLLVIDDKDMNHSC
jgi:hypothetical protein